MISGPMVDCVAPAAVLIEAIDPALLSDPIDFLLADHYRQRMLCQLLDRLVREPPGAEASTMAEAART